MFTDTTVQWNKRGRSSTSTSQQMRNEEQLELARQSTSSEDHHSNQVSNSKRVIFIGSVTTTNPRDSNITHQSCAANNKSTHRKLNNFLNESDNSQ